MKILNDFIDYESKNNFYETTSLNNLNKFINGTMGSNETRSLIPQFDPIRTKLRNKINEMKKEYGYDLINILVPDKLNKELKYSDEMYNKCRLYNRVDIAKDMKSTEDIEIYMKNKDWFNETQKNILSLSGVDLNLAKDILNSYNFIFTLFPGMKKRIGACFVKDLNKNNTDKNTVTYAQYDSNTTSIELDINTYSDLESFRTSYFNTTIKTDGELGTYHPVNTDYRVVIIHELIHALDYGVLKVHKRNDMNNLVLPSEKIDDILSEKLHLDGVIVSNELSRYALEDKQEQLAEAITEFICSPNPRELSQRFAEEFFKIMYTRGNNYDRY